MIKDMTGIAVRLDSYEKNKEEEALWIAIKKLERRMDIVQDWMETVGKEGRLAAAADMDEANG